MTGRVDRTEELFLAAVELAEDARPEFLDRTCAGDAALRTEVEALLRLDGADDRLPGIELDDPAGERVGPYLLREPIGEGGMGIVFRAEQREPVRRTAALKILKSGLDSREVVARFEAERQALVLMDHPNIAKLYDAGTTEDGRPYFAMELIEGVSITEYCDITNQPLHDRIRLLLPVCRAIQHAHQKGVIHRDLKPSNVLVALRDGEPVPVVIDFGIAKATAGSLTDKTLHTSHHQILGTLEYMSPEQVEMSPLRIDTRSDVYALGVLLYELLAGVTPIDAGSLRSAALFEAQRMIRDAEPPRPSTRVSTLGPDAGEIARHRRLDPRGLSLGIRGDLDWIAMRCLEKDPQRRYQSAKDFADDLERHLRDEPVDAGPPGAIYRLRKLVRRHRVGAAVVASVLLAAVLALVLIFDERGRTRRALTDLRSAYADLEGVDRAATMRDLEESLQRGRRPATRRAALDDPDRFPAPERGFAWRWLSGRSPLHRSERIGFAGAHVGELAFDPDGEHLAMLVRPPVGGTPDLETEVAGEVQVRSARSRELVARLPRRALAFAFRGRRLVTADAGTRELLIWDPERGFERPVDRIVCTGVPVDVCATADLVAAVTKTQAGYGVEVFRDESTDGAAVPASPLLTRQRGAIRAIAVSPQRDRLAVGDVDGIVRVFDLRSGDPLARIDYGRIGERRMVPNGVPAVTDLAFDPSGERIGIAGANAGSAGVWWASTGGVLHLFEPLPESGHPRIAHGIAFGPDGRHVVVTDSSHSARVYSARTGQRLVTLPQYEGRAVAIGPDGRRVAIANVEPGVALSSNGHVTITDLADYPLPVELVGHRYDVIGLRVTPDAEAAFTLDAESVRKWNLHTGEQEFTVFDWWLSPSCLALRPHASGRPRELVVGGANGRGFVLDVASGRRLRELTLPEHVNRVAPHRTNTGFQSLAYTSGGDVLAVGPGTYSDGADKSVPCPILLIDADDFTVRRELRGCRSSANDLRISPDDRWLFVLEWTRGKRVLCWDLTSDRDDPCWQRDGFGGRCLALDPSGRRLYAQRNTKEIVVLDLATGNRIDTWEVSEGNLLGLEFDPSATHALLTTTARTTVWDAPPRHRLLSPMPGRPFGYFSCARFAGDHGIVASTSRGELTYYPVDSSPALFAARRDAWRTGDLVSRALELDSNRGPEPRRTALVEDAVEHVTELPGIDPRIRASALALLASTNQDTLLASEDAWNVLGRPSLTAAELARARRAAEVGAALDRPGTFEEAVTHLVLAVACYRDGDAAAALDALEVADTLAARRSTARCAFAPQLFLDHNVIAFALRALVFVELLGDRDRALAELEQAWELDVGGDHDEAFLTQAYRAVGIAIDGAQAAGPGAPIKAAGPPDAKVREHIVFGANLSPNAWVPSSTAAATLRLDYAEAVSLRAVRVLQTRPSADLVERITAIDVNGGGEHVVWPVEEAARDGNTFHYDGPEIRVRALRLTVRPTSGVGVDTVRLIGRERRPWPVHAAVDS